MSQSLVGQPTKTYYVCKIILGQCTLATNRLLGENLESGVLRTTGNLPGLKEALGAPRPDTGEISGLETGIPNVFGLELGVPALGEVEVELADAPPAGGGEGLWPPNVIPRFWQFPPISPERKINLHHQLFHIKCSACISGQAKLLCCHAHC